MPYSLHSINSTDRGRPAPQPSCPKCESPDTCSAAKRPTANSYWRCLRCGDVWNPSLLFGAPQRRWYR